MKAHTFILASEKSTLVKISGSVLNLILCGQDLVLRLGIHRKLEKHRGCVNALSFNADGNIIVTGSDDRMVMLWDWDTGLVKLEFQSGHSRNVLQARMMPYTDDRTLITCAADGEVSLITSPVP